MRGGNLLKMSEAYSRWSSACWDDVVTWTICTETWEQRDGEGEAHVHLLTCSICLFFLPEWVSGASSATVPHSNKQRQSSSSRSILWRAAHYERENGTATSAAGRRTDHPCQREFSSIPMARTWGELEVCVLKNSWPHVVGFLRAGRAAAERQAFLVALHLRSHLCTISWHPPCFNSKPPQPPLIQTPQLHTRNSEPVFAHTDVTEARRKMGGLHDNNLQRFRKTRFWTCVYVCVLACEVPWASYGSCKITKWRDQRDRFEAEGSSESVCTHPASFAKCTQLYMYHDADVITHTHSDPLGSTHENSHHPLVPRGETWRGSGLCFLWIPEEKPLIPGQDWANISSRHAPHTASIKTAEGVTESHFQFQVSFIYHGLYLKERSSNFKAEFRVLSAALYSQM